ncbi:MAG: GroES family chaperonin [Anaerolineae bacterium]
MSESQLEAALESAFGLPEPRLPLEPTGDRVVIRRDVAPEKTRSGLHIVETARPKPQAGLVLAAGPGVYQDGYLVPVRVQPGDRVTFGPYSGLEFEAGGETVIIMPEREIMAVLNEGATWSGEAPTEAPTE